MPVTVVPLVSPLTVRVSPSPGNDPAAIWTAAKLSSVSSKSVRLADGESNTGAASSTYVADGSTVMAGASFVAVTLISAAATLLSFTPSLTTTSMTRSAVPGSSLVLL